MKTQLMPSEYLTLDERKQLMTKSDMKATLEIAHTWSWIAFAMALVYFFPNALTIIIALFILGGKQLACAIIMHDASHYALFQSKKANNFVGNWLGGYAIMNDVYRYRPYHQTHHLNTGTDDDPDLSLTKGYPTSIASMSRKLARDLVGATGIKAQLGLLAMHLGFIKYTLAREIIRIKNDNSTFSIRVKKSLKNLYGPIVFQILFFCFLYWIGAPYLYLLWIGALLTTFNFSLRIRSIAEYSVVEDSLDPKKNTRTTYANFLEKLLFAPHHVNYHLEHHMMMGVPPYNLPAMHKLLKAKGFYENGTLASGYWNILKLAVKQNRVPILSN
jgi:fatty acid desaturase